MISNIFAGEVQFERPKDVSTVQYQLQELQNTIENRNFDKLAGAIRQVLFRWAPTQRFHCGIVLQLMQTDMSSVLLLVRLSWAYPPKNSPSTVS
jgi:hypothetical protein